MKQLQQVEIARMRQLADYLIEQVDPAKFDMRMWEKERYRPAKTFLFGLIEIEPACGFAGCAMGHAAFSKMFPGLVLAEHDGTVCYVSFSNDASLSPFSFGFYAAANVMGISLNAAEFLFCPDSYAGASDTIEVAARLYRFADKVENRIKRALYKPLLHDIVVSYEQPAKLELEAA